MKRKGGRKAVDVDIRSSSSRSSRSSSCGGRTMTNVSRETSNVGDKGEHFVIDEASVTGYSGTSVNVQKSTNKGLCASLSLSSIDADDANN